MKPSPALPPLDTKQRYSIDESIRYLRTSRKTIYADLFADPPRLKSITEGKRRYIPGSELARRSALPA